MRSKMQKQLILPSLWLLWMDSPHAPLKIRYLTFVSLHRKGDFFF